MQGSEPTRGEGEDKEGRDEQSPAIIASIGTKTRQKQDAKAHGQQL